jgi:threonine synthase
MFNLRCISCGQEYPGGEIIYTCQCGGLLEAFQEAPVVDRETLSSRPQGVWRYREFLPLREGARIISLGEGGTPLYRAENLAAQLGMEEVFIKNEGANPTGSFKDRGMTVGVTWAMGLGSKAVGCASTGNTSASLAAYAAKAGIKCVVLLPSGKIALGKLAQAILHGAVVVGIKGNFDIALKLVRQASEEFNIYLLNSINPWRLEGQKTEAYEIAEQLGYEPPDAVVVPMGNCGNISAIWKGFQEFMEAGLTEDVPRMIGIQAQGAAPVVEAFRKGRESIEPLSTPETIATAIRIGAPVNAPKALRAIRESQGHAETVSDAEITEAQRMLARWEGIGVEPASAASVAGLRRLRDTGVIGEDERVVCVTTGHALKDPEMIFNHYEKPAIISPSLEELRKVLGMG